VEPNCWTPCQGDVGQASFGYDPITPTVGFIFIPGANAVPDHGKSESSGSSRLTDDHRGQS
jgi:hypothetical protein